MVFKPGRQMISRLLTLLVLLVMIPVMAFASSVGTVNCSSLNLRSKASKDSKSLQTLQKGDEVTILSTTGDWYKVTYGKYTGFVMKKFITKGKALKGKSFGCAACPMYNSCSGETPRMIEPAQNTLEQKGAEA